VAPQLISRPTSEASITRSRGKRSASDAANGAIKAAITWRIAVTDAHSRRAAMLVGVDGNRHAIGEVADRRAGVGELEPS